jgi:polysaccharide biosynthesis protein PslH
LDLPRKMGVSDFLNYGRKVFSSKPYTLNNYCRGKAVRALEELLKSESFDLVVADFLNAAGLLPERLQIPVVIFTHNVEALIFRRHWEVSQNPLWKAMYWYEYKRTEHIERKYLSKASHVLAVSQTDKDYFAGFMDPQKITVIPTGVDTDFFKPSKGAEVHPNSLVFTGSMDWAPNEDGILYFVERVLPLVREQIPDVTLQVVGRSPSQRVRSLMDIDTNIRVTGRVEDIRPYVQQASVYIVPLRVGSGTRLKIFEAMSMAKPVVSTSVGAEGLPVTHGKNILLADDPAVFASNIVSLLQNSTDRERLGQEARNLVEKNYGWSSVADQFRKVLATVCTRASASAG